MRLFTHPLTFLSFYCVFWLFFLAGSKAYHQDTKSRMESSHRILRNFPDPFHNVARSNKRMRGSKGSWQAIKEFGKKIEGEAKCLEEVSPEILIAALIRRMSLLAFEKTTLVCCYEKYLEWRQHIYGSYFKKLVRESFELRMKALDAKRDLITYFDHTYVERRQSNSQDIDGHENKVNGTS
ncbi:hypothetical protein FA10DRAFT_261963 [Acaromyces ingoldii]|uniref:Uncharacterized protein n=1 Tax=Acaromyces ingoldii TaxID=215250 RepID=A0A316YHH0_9BASI|nr:hypothetical protein FA10DRAFT_261963 [Acaromyces ingoldii]PWN88612.1 hypothetical protein FA10DRAFT_261963 [Acaromyces ingoldii]